MASPFIEMIKETFRDPNQIDLNKINHLVEETLVFFGQLKTKIQSPDSEERSAALKEALAVKEILETQMNRISQLVQVDPLQLATLAANQMDDGQKELMKEIKAKFEALNPQQPSVVGKRKKPIKMRI